MTSPLLRKPFGTHGKVHEITPASAGWRYVGFSLYRLRAGETAAEATGGDEVILVMVEGKARRHRPPDRTGASSASGWTSSRRLRRIRLYLPNGTRLDRDRRDRLRDRGLRRARQGRPPGAPHRPGRASP